MLRAVAAVSSCIRPVHGARARVLPFIMRLAPCATFSSSTSSSPSSPRPFRVLGLQQIAIGALAKTPLTELWSGLLGLERVGTYRAEKENVDEDILHLGPRHSPFAVEVDLMQPIDANKSPKVHVPTLNHIGLWVDDLPAAVQWLTAQGMRFTPGGIRKGASGYDVCFLHPKGDERSPKSGEGVLIELVQAPKSVIDAFQQLN